MADQTEELIKEIAMKHGIAVHRDDPIMVLQTINARLMQDNAKIQQEMLDSYKEELEALALRWSSDSKAMAEKILNASLSASKESMGKIMQEGAKEATAAVGSEVATALSRAGGSLRAARKIAIWNVVASCLTLAAVVIWAVVIK